MTVDRARAVREERTFILREINTGERSLLDVLERPPSCVLEMDVYDLLLAVRGVGRERARIVFERADVWPHTHVDELSTAQREGIRLHLPACVE